MEILHLHFVMVFNVQFSSGSFFFGYIWKRFFNPPGAGGFGTSFAATASFFFTLSLDFSFFTQHQSRQRFISFIWTDYLRSLANRRRKWDCGVRIVGDGQMGSWMLIRMQSLEPSLLYLILCQWFRLHGLIITKARINRKELLSSSYYQWYIYIYIHVAVDGFNGNQIWSRDYSVECLLVVLVSD